MSNQRSVGKFCSVVVTYLTATSDSLSTLNGIPMGVGATAYCLENGKSYRYISATAGLGGLSPYAVLAPISGAWVEQESSADASMFILGTANFNGSSVVVTGGYSALPAGSAFYDNASYVGTNVWSLNTTSGALVYAGLAGQTYLISGSLSFSNEGLGLPYGMYFGVTQNGFLIGRGTPDSASSAVSTPATGSPIMQITQQFYAVPAYGDFFQHVFLLASGSTANRVTAYAYQATYQQVT